MLGIVSLILLLLPIIFQFIYGTRAIYKTIEMSFAKVSFISVFSQILFSIATFSVAKYNFSKYFDEHPNQTRCGTPLAALLFSLIFLIIVLILLIVFQFLIKIWKERRNKSN